ncbi:unnamed protein product [Timema podura]|uniref:Ring finger protein 25 n=1 Tax=Timema podura TaxID=61482 RepID=A0ABN7NU44_TIMPD|nr:unnamed protein product [Timema podura]
MDEVVVRTNESGSPVSVEIVVVPSTAHDALQQYVCLTLVVDLPLGYPDVIPTLQLRNPRGLDDVVISRVEQDAKEKCDSFCGQPVIYELIELYVHSNNLDELPEKALTATEEQFSAGNLVRKTDCSFSVLAIDQTYKRQNAVTKGFGPRYPVKMGSSWNPDNKEVLCLMLAEYTASSLNFSEIMTNLVREQLTASNLPSCQCAICLYGFREGDQFTKTHCYHYFHSHCLACHVTSTEKSYKEEQEKLPAWQRNQRTCQVLCPVCREPVSCDMELLSNAPQPLDVQSAHQFELSDELRALQDQMAALFIRQKQRGGIIDPEAEESKLLLVTNRQDTEEDVYHHQSTALVAVAVDWDRGLGVIGRPLGATQVVEGEARAAEGVGGRGVGAGTPRPQPPPDDDGSWMSHRGWTGRQGSWACLGNSAIACSCLIGRLFVHTLHTVVVVP